MGRKKGLELLPINSKEAHSEGENRAASWVGVYMGRLGKNLLGRGNSHGKGMRMPDRFGRKRYSVQFNDYFKAA